VEYEDKLTISTPEGVEMTLALAGVASRFAAELVDLIIQIVLFVVIVSVAAAVGHNSGWVLATSFILIFLLFFGYNVAFEVLNSGRTPGKMMNGLRVVRVSGHPVGFITSSIRNVIRLIDFLPSAYLLGAILIMSTSKNQRLGDVIAGTLVIRQRRGHSVPLPQPASRRELNETYRTWDTSRITADELAAVTQFLDRRWDFEDAARVRLCETLAARLRPKVTGAPPEMPADQFLLALVALRRTLGS
jgi:uncharacterized RDD family membrane protein YckC